MESQVLVVGGGLAGMVIARELRKAGVSVGILEASSRLGGKAGSERAGGKLVDHGYHIFPPWYANTRKLLDDLGIGSSLIDLHSFFYLRGKGARGSRWVEFRDLESPFNLFGNIFHGVTPWPETVLSAYALFQMANEPFRYRSALDRTSLNGFLRSCPFVTEGVAEFQQRTLLQGSSIPAYEVSAMTMQRVFRTWIRTTSPLFSILNGDLQSRFIVPFQEDLVARGASISLEQPIAKVEVSGGRVTGLRRLDGTRIGTRETMYVLATPLEVTVRFVDPELFAAETRKPSFPSSEKALADLHNLRTAPMAAFHLTLKRKVDLPKEHVLLYNSRFLTSFIDLAEHWNLATSEIAIIASNFIPLESLVDDDPSAPYVRGIDSPAAQAVIDDLLEFVPEITRGDIDEDRSFSIFNVRHQLFLNTVGAWPFRPSTRTRLENLFVAGDYCQTEADITTMESAVISGLNTAAAILEKAGNPSTVHIESLKTDAGWNPLRSYPRIPLRMVEYATMPLMAALFGAWVLWKALWPSDEA